MLRRSPMSRSYRPTGPDHLTVQDILYRDEGRCVVCGEGVIGQRGWSWSIHHRRGRDGKPDCHKPQNLILVCGASNVDGCHGKIHQRRSWSRPLGLWLSRAAAEDPLLIPVAIHRESRWVYLTDDGRYAEHPPGCAA